MGGASATLAHDVETIGTLIRRSANELIRVPGAAIPGVLAPTIFFLGLTSVFGSLTLLPGFDTDSYASFMVPVSMLQGAGFTGAAPGSTSPATSSWACSTASSPPPPPAGCCSPASSPPRRSAP